MDPISLILSYLIKDRSRASNLEALRLWYAGRSFRPTVAEVADAAARRGLRLPRTWKSTAIRLGAVQ